MKVSLLILPIMLTSCALLFPLNEPKRGQVQGAGTALTASDLGVFLGSTGMCQASVADTKAGFGTPQTLANGRVEVWMKGQGWVTLRAEDLRVVMEPSPTPVVQRRNWP